MGFIYNRENYILSESPLKSDLLKLFNKDEKLTIFDIGGCEGEESIRYSRLFPFASIYTFEPLPKNLDLINYHIEKYGVINVELIPFALSDKEGESDFYVSSGYPENQPKNLDWDFGNKSSSLLQPNTDNNPKWLDFKDVIKVKTTTLFNFTKDKRISEIDFIHMDVQGAELNVLKGAADYIKHVKAVWLEVSNIELYKDQPITTNIENFMKSNSFVLVKSVFEGNVGDQFYINKNYFKLISFSFFSKKFQWFLKK